MNFATMLAMNVQPQQPTRGPDKPKTRWKRDTQTMQSERHIQTVEKYKAVMGEWIRTRDIEARLDMARCSAYDTLERYREGGLIERRPLNNEPWNQRSGWEWRWIV